MLFTMQLRIRHCKPKQHIPPIVSSNVFARTLILLQMSSHGKCLTQWSRNLTTSSSNINCFQSELNSMACITTKRSTFHGRQTCYTLSQSQCDFDLQYVHLDQTRATTKPTTQNMGQQLYANSSHVDYHDKNWYLSCKVSHAHRPLRLTQQVFRNKQSKSLLQQPNFENRYNIDIENHPCPDAKAT